MSFFESTSLLFDASVTLQQCLMNMIPQLLERGDLYDRLGQSHVEQLLEYLIELAGKTPTDVEALFQIFLGTLEGIK